MTLDHLLILLEYIKYGAPIIKHTTINYASQNETIHEFEEVNFRKLELKDLLKDSVGNGNGITTIEYDAAENMLPLAEKFNCKIKWLYENEYRKNR